MLKIRTVIATALTILMFSVALPVLAVSHRGGEWNYGGHHDPDNWGAFSNYYHATNYHWSYVGSTGRANERTVYAGARSAAHAFINTNFGEHVNFDAGW
ncbi:lactococcin 972 family bacteriocin [Streptococcus merionis]|uniref:Bacteriocin n=1 Tax=Streptococcus merionis TaxID=400065 RepID=A0A239SNS9_9STRE|nr:lactococcin 972 family bacteriocin [Streptococcus merionis]SNU87050.1 bacteriocin [Streptococcus merionis]